MYNLSALNNVTGFGDMVGVANNFTEGWLIQLFLIAIFVIIILAIPSEDFEIKIAISCFICFFISVMLTYVGWVYYLYPMGFLLILGFDMLYIYSNR